VSFYVLFKKKEGEMRKKKCPLCGQETKEKLFNFSPSREREKKGFSCENCNMVWEEETPPLPRPNNVVAYGYA